MNLRLVEEGINRITATDGIRSGLYFYATFTCRDVLEFWSFEVTQDNLRSVAYVVYRGYPKSTFGGGTARDGFTLNMKVRSK
jgi:hypothetical protein